MDRQQLTPMDAMFLSIERPNTPMHTAGIVLFDGPLPFQLLYDTIAARLHLVPRFLQRLVEVPYSLGYPVWAEDPAFDLSYHVRHAALPAPGTEEQLCDYAARLISRPLDRAKPLWELYVIDGVDEGSRSALVSKTHHAMIDGASAMDLATVLLDFGPDPQPAEAPPDRPNPPPLPTPQELISDAVRLRLSELKDLGQTLRAAADAPQRLADAIGEGAAALASTLASVARPAAPSALNTGPGLHRRFAMVRSTLQTFKDVKNAAGATVNDVILSVCADALGRLLRSRGEETDEKTLRAMVPVSVRTESSKGTIGNEITSIFPELPIGEMAPLDRLARVHSQMQDLKESSQAVGADLLVNLTRWAPPTLHSMASRLGSRTRLMNLVISNVPGPQIPLYSCGQRLAEPYAVIPLSRGQTLAIGVTSYSGGIYFGINADRDAHPDLPSFAEFVQASIEDLQEESATSSGTAVTEPDTQVAVGGADA